MCAKLRVNGIPVTNRCYLQHLAFHILFLHHQILVTVSLLAEFSNCGATESGVKWHWNKTGQKAWKGLVNWWGFHIPTWQPSAHLSQCTRSFWVLSKVSWNVGSESMSSRMPGIEHCRSHKSNRSRPINFPKPNFVKSITDFRWSSFPKGHFERCYSYPTNGRWRASSMKFYSTMDGLASKEF